MIQVTIEEITVEKDGMDCKDVSTGQCSKMDKWNRKTIYTQIFPKEIAIQSIIRILNGGRG